MPEIERKFRVTEVPREAARGQPIEQCYLAQDGHVEVRIRDREGSCTLTVKGGRGIERSEVEIAISRQDFDELRHLAGDRSIEKHRVEVPITGGLVAEVDVYAGDLEGLAVVEVEFADRAQADRFVPPSWFGDELTGIDGWSNADLAADGRPDR